MLTNRFLSHLDPDRRQKLGEIVRFGVVGVVATALQYVIYLVCVRWMHATLANTIGYVLSFIFNFFATTRFTFRTQASVRRGAGFALSHLVNYGLQTVSLLAFIHMGVPEQWAPLPMFCICVPINFLLVRFFMKR